MPAPVLQFKRGNAGVAGTVPALRPGEPAISLNNFDFFIGIDTSVSNNKFFGSHRYWGREDGTTSLRLKLVDKDGTNYVAVKSPDTLAGIVTYTLPGTQGGTQTVLTNDGSGNLSWSSGSLNAVFSGITTIGGDFLDVNVNSDFSGITTFSNTTNNTLGDENTGAVQLDGGMGIAKNLTVKENLYVGGYSEFVGVVTFKGGTINLGDADTDDINVAGEFISNLVPNTDNTYDIGDGAASKRWRHASFSGIGTFATGAVIDAVQIGISGNNIVDTTAGPLYLDSASGTTIINDHLDVVGDLDVTGNVYIGGTTVTLRGEDVIIENRDILLGYTTSVTPNDTTANHGGIAIASTEGSPLALFTATGINTFPDTYKQLMWFKSGTLGFATDAFGFNYGLAIGTTSMANGIRLAVGSGITMTDTEISATTFRGSVIGNVSSADQVKTITASDTNATYHITFVDSHNGSATNETVYTDDGIYYNPGTNTFTTQHGSFTGNVFVSGIATVGTSLSSPTIETSTIKSSGGTNAITLNGANVTVAGDLYVNGNTTQVNTSTLTVEDTLVELGLVDGSAPGSDLDKDLGLLFNYYSGSAKKAAVFWDDSASRIVFADEVTESSGVLTVASNAYASIEIEALWVNDCAGQSQIISCTGTERFLENITVDAGQF